MKTDREEYLAEQLNDFLHRSLGLENKDYYRELDMDKIIRLKSILSDINNIVSLKLSLKFCDWLASKGEIYEKIKDEIRQTIMETKPNANGYDIDFSKANLMLIAEVKGTIPYKQGKRFGAQQKDGIIKDIRGLLAGKAKAKKSNIQDYKKFLILYDNDCTREAMEYLRERDVEGIDWKKVVSESEKKIENNDCVYLVFIKPD